MTTPTDMAKKNKTVEGVFPTNDVELLNSGFRGEVAVGNPPQEASWNSREVVVDIFLLIQAKRQSVFDVEKRENPGVRFRVQDGGAE